MIIITTEHGIRDIVTIDPQTHGVLHGGEELAFDIARHIISKPKYSGVIIESGQNGGPIFKTGGQHGSPELRAMKATAVKAVKELMAFLVEYKPVLMNLRRTDTYVTSLRQDHMKLLQRVINLEQRLRDTAGSLDQTIEGIQKTLMVHGNKLRNVSEG